MQYLSCSFPKLYSSKKLDKNGKLKRKKKPKSGHRHRPKVYGREFSKNFYPASSFYNDNRQKMGVNRFGSGFMINNTPHSQMDYRQQPFYDGHFKMMVIVVFFVGTVGGDMRWEFGV
jgi:hypothetical protein